MRKVGFVLILLSVSAPDLCMYYGYLAIENYGCG